MNEPLKVGDVCVIVNLSEHLELNGHECTIIEPRAEHLNCTARGEWERVDGHRIALDDGRYFIVAARCLRKKRPPNEMSSWDRIESLTRWNPQRVEA